MSPKLFAFKRALLCHGSCLYEKRPGIRFEFYSSAKPVDTGN